MGPQFKILVRIQNAGQGPGQFRMFWGADHARGKNHGVVTPWANMAWFGDLCQKWDALTQRLEKKFGGRITGR